MKINRRETLLGFLFAPALVRVESIMPISSQALTYHTSSGLLSAQNICDEFAKIIKHQKGKPINKVATVQKSVDMEFSAYMLTLPMSEFSKKFIQPAVKRLLNYSAGEKIALGKLAMVENLDACAISEGSSIRYVRDYYIRTDSVIQRFDVLMTKD